MGNILIRYHDIAIGAARGALVRTTSENNLSNPQHLVTGQAKGGNFNTFEGNQWLLDGNGKMYDGRIVPFWTKAVSDSYAFFPLRDVVSLEINFDKKYAAPGITLLFESDEDCCDDITVEYYSDVTRVSHEEYKTAGKAQFLPRYTNISEPFNRMVIYLWQTKLPLRRGKLNGIYFGAIRSFGTDELRSASLQIEGDPISNTVSTSTLDWTLNINSPIYFNFQDKQPVYVYNGDELLSVTFIRDSEQIGAGLYKIHNEDIIGLLDEGVFKARQFNNEPVQDVLNQLLNYRYSVVLDDSLKKETITGFIKDCSRREALQQICFAIGACATSFRSTELRIMKVLDNPPTFLDRRDIFTGQKVKQEDIVTEVSVTAHELSLDPDGDIEIDGVKYRDNKTVKTRKNESPIAQNKEKVYKVDNMTLVNLSNVDKILDSTYNYFMQRDELSARIVLGKHDIGETVTIPKSWGEESTGVITSMNVKLSNLTVADLKVKVTQ